MLRQERTKSVSDIYHVMLRDTNHWLKKHKVVLYATLVMLLLTSCRWEPDYPPQLTQADSLIMRGYYAEADSLLSAYDSVSHDDGGAVAHYRRLLALSRQFVDDNITSDDFSLADSLCRYYDGYGTRDKYGKVLCFLGEVYCQSGDYPSAMNTWLKAKSIAERNSYSYLACWLYRNIGDLYFEQRMLEECIDYYKRAYDVATNNKDTLRMAQTSFGMGRVYTIQDNVDSTLYYYKKAIDLAEHTNHPENIIPVAKSQLADIYIQIEEYETAQNYMPHDSLNDANWAYWHLGQNHTDSAIIYLEKIKDRLGFYGQAETLYNLAQLEEKKGNSMKALKYYNLLKSAEDSIEVHSQAEDTKRINAQYNLNLIKSERDELARHSSFIQTVLIAILVIFIIACILGYYVWNYYQQKRSSELAQEKLLRHAEEEKNRQSIHQIEENNKRIAVLEKALAEARLKNDAEATTRLELDTELLKSENLNIEANQKRRLYLTEKFQESSLFIKIKKHAGEENFHLSNEEWEKLTENLDMIYNNFTQRLYSLVQLSDIELKVCYLIKLEIAPVNIATMLYKSKAAISMLRQRLYEKLTHKKGTAKQFDEFILNF